MLHFMRIKLLFQPISDLLVCEKRLSVFIKRLSVKPVVTDFLLLYVSLFL